MSAGADLETGKPLEQLFARLATGDQRALEAIYRQTASMLLGLVMRIVKRREIAEDLVQETFLILWQRRTEYDVARGTPMAWLATIARHKAIDHIRRADSKFANQDISEIDIAGEFVDPLAALDKAQDQARVVADLSRLDPERLQMILLAFVFGWSRERLGEHFHKPTGTIKTWLHRSLTEIQVKARETKNAGADAAPAPFTPLKRPAKLAETAIA